MDQLIIKLHGIDAVKFGKFKLKSGIDSPVYFDLRVIVSFPSVLNEVAEQLWQKVNSSSCTYTSVCGVPYTALPIATCMSVAHEIPMLMRRKEAKSYGTKKLIEGRYKEGDVCLIVEDVVTSGSSVMETVAALKQQGLVVKDAVVLLDREQGAREMLATQGIQLHSLIGITDLMKVLESHKRVEADMVEQVKNFIEANNTFSPSQPKKALTHKVRSETVSNVLTRQLFKIMADKKTNLAVAADVNSCQQLLQLAESVGPYICVLKTHIDILEDFTSDFIQQLKAVAEKHNFLIFEDRKFADIGNTVKHQYTSGVYHIRDWAHIVNAHALPGPGIIQALQQASEGYNRGCLLIAEMSSEGSLAKDSYTQECVSMAEKHKDFIMGFICQNKLSDDPNLVHMTPGVRLEEGGDGLGQQYLTPQHVIGRKGCDVIIVGRSIIQASDPAQAARKYQEAGYTAYENALS